uniref:Uncharacterized protein n=1 Tax=Heterorhabditis bacteriophora TaxID=37862 RepID=A0A1I7WJM3_HETBA
MAKYLSKITDEELKLIKEEERIEKANKAQYEKIVTHARTLSRTVRGPCHEKISQKKKNFCGSKKNGKKWQSTSMMFLGHSNFNFNGINVQN